MSAHRHRVLLVEDDVEVREVMQMTIEADGVEVLEASSASDALALLQGGLRCCVIVLDWRMEGMSGEEFCRAQTADHRIADVPVIVFTGDPAAAEPARELGVREILVKPSEPMDLIAAVRRHCGA